MSINGIGVSGHPASWTARKTQRNLSESDFASRIAAVNAASSGSQTSRKASGDAAIKSTISGGDSYVRETSDFYASGVYTKRNLSAVEESDFPIETERYKIEDASYIENTAAFRIVDKETGRSLYIREDQLMIQKDAKTGLAFVINMDQPFSYNVPVTGELKDLLKDIMEKRGGTLEEVPLQGGLTVNQDPKTGLRYLAIQGNEAEGISVIFTSQKDRDILEKLADEFTQYPVCSQHIAGLYALLEISGNLKREKDGMTLLTPNGITYIPYNGDPDKAWNIKIPRQDYSAARKYLTMKIDASNAQTWLNQFPSAKLIDTDMDPLNYYNNNGSPDDGSNAASDEQEAETQSRIIVKPDGSRVLMITVDIGGTQTAMSLKISEPTDMQNDYLKQENNPNNMSIPNIGITTDEIPETAGEK